MNQNPRTKMTGLRIGLLSITAAAGLAILSGCATAKDPVFKFTVFHYNTPVIVKSWTYRPEESDSPEGAALNVTSAMKSGDIDSWLSNWDETERPQLTPAERDGLAKNWSSLKDGQVSVLNRVVSGTVVMMELSVAAPDGTAQKVQVPLKYEGNRWWLTSVDPSTDYMNWESASIGSKIVNNCEPTMLENFLEGMNKVAMNSATTQP